MKIRKSKNMKTRKYVSPVVEILMYPLQYVMKASSDLPPDPYPSSAPTRRTELF